MTGQAKTDYQREYMRKRRSNTRSNTEPVSVRPVTPEAVRSEQMPRFIRPEGISDNQWAYIKYKKEKEWEEAHGQG